MKHPSEWRYTDEAFAEVQERVDVPIDDYFAQQDVFYFRDRQDCGKCYESMGWFEDAYLGRQNNQSHLVCWLYWPERTARVAIEGTGDVVAELRRIDSPRQLVEWCMMVREMVDG